MSVRVRYAPSPTGEPHVGNLRSALFNWLLARCHGGSFIVRIEDTDQNRKMEGSVDQTLDALRWLGLDWDEGPEVGGAFGPYYQSQRLDRYHEAADRLLAVRAAYTCICTPQRLADLRKAQQKRKQPPGYDGRCRKLSPSERAREREAAGAHVVRFAMPEAGETLVEDAVRGEVRFENTLLDDFVILKSDGFPTYHLANVIDDAAMEVSHVLRAEEWLPSTPRHLQLYRTLELKPPIFAHLPIILGADGGKLSKRHGATSIAHYRAEGYLPEAMLNFMALLGWSLDDKTTYLSREELVAGFALERVGKTGATFDLDRLEAMNGHYVRALPPDQFAERLRLWLEDDLPPSVARPLDGARLRAIGPLVQERIKRMAEVIDLTDFFFLEEPLFYRNKDLMGKGFRDNPSGALHALEATRAILAPLSTWDASAIESALRALAERLELKPGHLFTPIRVAATGKTAAPPLFETLALIGRTQTIQRLDAAAERLARPDD